MIDFLLNTPSLDYFKGQQIVIWSKKAFLFFVFTDLENSKGLETSSRLVTRTAHRWAWLWRRHTLSPACSSLSDHVSWLNLASMAWSPFPPAHSQSRQHMLCTHMQWTFPTHHSLLFKINLSVCYVIWVLKGNLQSNLLFFFFNQIL